MTAFFILIEVAFFILCNDSYLYTFVYVSDKIHLPFAIVPGIAFFVFAQLLVHFCYCLLAAVFAAWMIDAFRIKPENYLLFAIAVWLAGIVTIMLANSYYYPNSRFAQLCTVFLSYRAIGYVLEMLLIAWTVTTAVCVARVRSLHPGNVASFELRSPDAKSASGLLLAFVLILCALFYFKKPPIYTSAATPTKPNIILIGVDSLRPDVLDFFSGEAHTPFMSQFLSQATVFGEAITPLARTYPSWVGILTGQYPTQTGVRTNLSGHSKINLSQTLPAILQQHGYETYYATDETRFSNIDNSFGFDASITPPVGLNDFLLGTFGDFPLSNLLVNTFAGKWLFPYSYGNRSANVTYNPNSFLKMLHSALLRDHNKPLFMAIHFCLPHHPYLYDRMVGDPLIGQERYLQSVQRADQQVRDFLALLQQAQLLDHAVVVLLSDHGEALEFPGDRLTEREAYVPHHQIAPAYYPPSEHNIAMDQSVGHGTDVLGLPQYHSLLAFRLYGLGEQRVAVIPGVVTLLDIKPTVLETVTPQHNSLSSPRMRGPISLLPLITGNTNHLPTRMLFLESDYSPDAVRSIYPETRKLLLEGADLFQISPGTTRLMVKNDTLAMIIKSKQHAVIYGNWMLALYPQENGSKILVLINLRSGTWTTDLTTAFAKDSPARAMQTALQHFYGREVG